MPYEKFLRDNLIKKCEPDFRQISHQLKRSLKDLKTAEANVKIDLTWSLTIAYHAMIRAGRALMFAKGFLPTTKQTHKTIVIFTAKLFGKDYDVLIRKFERLRRRRHDFIYDAVNHITMDEAKSSIDTAKKLIYKIIEIISEINPAAKLF
jgi:uncharacterized protein (UPF0332 family)